MLTEVDEERKKKPTQAINQVIYHIKLRAVAVEVKALEERKEREREA